MTGQIVPKNSGTVNDVKDKFKSFFFNVLDILGDMGNHEIASSILRISSEEIDWAADYLANYHYKLKSKGYDPEIIIYFLIVKTIAIISLWHGYIMSGGTSPPLREPPQINMDNKLKIQKDHSKPKAVVVIPTRISYVEGRLANLLNNIIWPISKSNLITKIMLISKFDGKVHKYLGKQNKIELIELENDTGPSHARNIGIDISLSLGAEVVVFMDDDILINKMSSIDQLVTSAYRYKGIVAPLVASSNTTWFDIYHDYDGTLNGVYFSKYNSPPRLLYATTCSVAISTTLFEDGLRFDENFKLAAGEDIDFSLRALKRGFPIIAADDIIFNHDYGYSSKDDDLDIFIGRYVRYGKGNFNLVKKHSYYYSLLSCSKERQTRVNLNDFGFVSTKLKHISNIIEVIRK